MLGQLVFCTPSECFSVYYEYFLYFSVYFSVYYECCSVYYVCILLCILWVLLCVLWLLLSVYYECKRSKSLYTMSTSLYTSLYIWVLCILWLLLCVLLCILWPLLCILPYRDDTSDAKLWWPHKTLWKSMYVHDIRGQQKHISIDPACGIVAGFVQRGWSWVNTRSCACASFIS